MRLRLAMACGIVVTAVVSAAAAPPQHDYVIDVWGTDRGLPTSFVTSIVQTPDGYLWVGTQNGLLRFDGQRFVGFDPDNTPALRHARVEHLFVDPAGALWANTYDGSLTSVRDGRFHTEWTGTGPVDFEAFLASSRGEPVFVLDRGPLIRRRPDATSAWEVSRPPGNALPLFAEDGTGAIWVRSVDGRLWRWRDGTFEAISTAGLSGTVQCVASVRYGRVWVGTDVEIAVHDGGRFRIMTPLNGEARLDVSAIHFARDGTYWVVANGRARRARDRAWIWAGEEGRGLTGPFRQSVNLVEDRRGGFWFTHYGKGVLHVAADGAARWITAAEGLPSNRVRDALEDREGNIWLVIERSGLARLRDAWFTTLPAGDGPRDTAIASVAEDPAGALWIGSLGGGLQR